MSLENKTVLSARTEDRNELRREIEKTLDAVFSSCNDDSAFSSINPYELRKRISSLTVLPEKGIGFDNALDVTAKEIMPHMLRTWSCDYMPHLHSPALLESLSAELMINTFNDSMDSWD